MESVQPLKYGQLAPDFSLASASGQVITRHQFRGKQGLLLIFFEDPGAATHLLQNIGRDAAEYRELNAAVLGIGHCSIESLKLAAPEVPFTLLADPDGRAWRAFTHSAEFGYAVFVLDTYSGVDSQRVVRRADELPDASTLLGWVQAAQYKCSI